MRTLLPVGALTSFFTMAVLLGPAPCRSQDQSVNAGIRDRFIGAWRLAWLEEPGADGKVHRADCTGLLVFTRDGHMSVHVMYRNPHATQAGPAQYARGGYEASFGTYKGRSAQQSDVNRPSVEVYASVSSTLKHQRCRNLCF